MRALALNGTLKPSPAKSSTDELTRVVLDALGRQDVDCEMVRLVDYDIAPGVVRSGPRRR
jgi:multimeric flavodoxin WrbA